MNPYMNMHTQFQKPNGEWVNGTTTDTHAKTRVLQDCPDGYQVAYYEDAQFTYCPFAEILPINVVIAWQRPDFPNYKSSRAEAMEKISKIITALSMLDKTGKHL